MRTSMFATIAALLVLAPAGAWAPSDARLSLTPRSRLWVSGTSTLRAFECRAPVLESDIAAAAGAIPAVLGGEKAVRRVEVRIPAGSLECGNGTMNDHMRRAVRASEHATIAFHLASYDLARSADGVTGTLTGTLSLGGVERPVAIQATGRGAGADSLRVTGTHALRMSDYGLRAPTLMLGTLKVGDVVTVGFDLVLAADPSVATAR